MSEHITITHERTDDIPVIIAFLQKMRVAELIDTHFPTNGHWTGLSLGQMLVVWLTFIISEGDHRLSHVEPWVAAHQHTLSRSLHHEVLPRDCTDDRLATGLDYLCVAENWAECECALNQTLIRVYDLRPNTIRVDPTTVSAYVTPDGLFQLGHSKDHRPDLPQLKSALATLDPLGLPMTIATGAGNTAADPLYLPAIAQVRRSVGLAGMTYIGDGTIAARATRADIVAHQDCSLCPLSAKQVSAEELDRLLEPIWSSEQPLEEVRLTAEGQAEVQAEPDAVGFAYAVEQVGPGPSGQPQRWQERRVVVRSLAHVRLQEESRRQRAQRAVDEIPDVFRTLVAQARSGDTSTGTTLRELMSTSPGLSAQVGDVFSHVEQKLLGRVAGTNLLQREAYTSSLETLEHELSQDTRQVEHALIKQIRTDMLILSHAQERLIDYPTETNNTLVNSAHRRLLSSLRTLHTLQRVLPPVNVNTVNIAQNQINLS